jgi:hypothetical protein
MQVKDFLQLATALVALVVASATFYFNLYGRPRLKLLTADRWSFNYTNDGRLVLALSFAIINEGARGGALVRLHGDIAPAGAVERMELEWAEFYRSQDIGKPGAQFTPWLAFSGWPEPVAIPGRSAEVKSIKLVTMGPFALAPGRYAVRFLAEEGFAGARPDESRYELDITEAFATYLRDSCTADAEGHIAHMGVLLRHGGVISEPLHRLR